jgi:phospholipid transport system transporter-binding protein
MSNSMIKKADITFNNNTFLLMGELDFSNVMSVYKQSLPHFYHCPELTFDFSQVKDSNSAGLALIMEWIKLARRCEKPIRFNAISKDLMAIAKIAGLEAIVRE